MSEFSNKIKELNTHYDILKGEYSTGNCWRLSTTMQEMEEALREHIQETTKDEIIKIMEKLKADTPLDTDELNYVKLWICGDAENYVKLENNYNDWVEELNRLIAEIAGMDTQSLDFDASSKVRALLLDGIRTIGDIIFFLKQKERVKNFEESTQEIDPQERDLLLRLLGGKILSPNE